LVAVHLKNFFPWRNFLLHREASLKRQMFFLTMVRRNMQRLCNCKKEKQAKKKVERNAANSGRT